MLPCCWCTIMMVTKCWEDVSKKWKYWYWSNLTTWWLKLAHCDNVVWLSISIPPLYLRYPWFIYAQAKASKRPDVECNKTWASSCYSYTIQCLYYSSSFVVVLRSLNALQTSWIQALEQQQQQHQQGCWVVLSSKHVSEACEFILLVSGLEDLLRVRGF